MEPTVIRFTAQAQALIDRLDKWPRHMLEACARVLDQQNQLTIAHCSERYLTYPREGPPQHDGLRVRTGKLRQSLRAKPARIVGNGLTSSIGSNLRYAGIHEWGGQTAPHIIRAKPGHALAFKIAGGTFQFFTKGQFRGALKGLRGKTRASAKGGLLTGMIFRQLVHHPGSRMPARAYVRRAIVDRMDDYRAALSQAAVDSLTSGFSAAGITR